MRSLQCNASCGENGDSLFITPRMKQNAVQKKLLSYLHPATQMKHVNRRNEGRPVCRPFHRITVLNSNIHEKHGEEARSFRRRKEEENARCYARRSRSVCLGITCRNRYTTSKSWRGLARSRAFVGAFFFIDPLAGMVIKDVLQEMLDDDMIIQEKVGTQMLYWIFPSQSYVLVRATAFLLMCRRSANWIRCARQHRPPEKRRKSWMSKSQRRRQTSRIVCVEGSWSED